VKFSDLKVIMGKPRNHVVPYPDLAHSGSKDSDWRSLDNLSEKMHNCLDILIFSQLVKRYHSVSMCDCYIFDKNYHRSFSCDRCPCCLAVADVDKSPVEAFGSRVAQNSACLWESKVSDQTE